MKKLTYIFSLLLFSSSISAQNIEEDVYLKVNSSQLLTGETLHFSAFVNSLSTNKPSPLSKVLYVQLINDQKFAVDSAKISIESGRGYGDFFLSSALNTGSYQLIAYTRWMKNFNQMFQMPVLIVNPFEEFVQPSSSKSLSEIQFYTSHAGIVKGLNNRIGIFGDFDNEKAIKAKVLDADGNNIQDLTLQSGRMNEFNLKPTTTGKYQLVIENEAGFKFVDFPVIADQGSKIQMRSLTSSFKLSVESTNEDFEGNIMVLDGSNKVLDDVAVSGSTFVLAKSKLNATIHKVVLRSADGKIEDMCSLANLSINTPENLSSVAKFNTRSLYNNLPKLPTGSYAISVRKTSKLGQDTSIPSSFHAGRLTGLPSSLLNALQSESELNAQTLNTYLLGLSNRENLISESNGEITFLPEHRGEIIEGQASVSGQPYANGLIGMGFVGYNDLAITKTDEKGNFILLSNSQNKDNRAFLTLINGPEEGQIEIESNFLSEFSTIESTPFMLDSIILSDILSSSVDIQIENAYFNVKQDNEENAVTFVPSFGHFDDVYNLAEYNRFPTLQETIAEYIPAVAVRKEGEKEILRVRPTIYAPDFKEKPLILLDGVPVQAHKILSFSPYKVKQVGVLSERIYYGSAVFDGVVSFVSVDGNMHDFEMEESAEAFEFIGVRNKKDFYTPDYSDSDLNRTPDRRLQIYWNPEYSAMEGQAMPTFYTSDVTGTFEISIDGFTSDAVPVSIRQYFTVEDIQQ